MTDADRHATRCIEAIKRHAQSEYETVRKSREWISSNYLINEFESTQVEVFVKKATKDPKNDSYRYFVKNANGRVFYHTSDPDKARRETCKYGNAIGVPFIIKTRKKGVNTTWMPASHRGSVQFKKVYKTQGEAIQQLPKLEILAPKLSDDEKKERAREWLRDRIAEGEKILKLEKQQQAKQATVEKQKKQIFEEMLAEGFGAW